MKTPTRDKDGYYKFSDTQIYPSATTILSKIARKGLEIWKIQQTAKFAFELAKKTKLDINSVVERAIKEMEQISLDSADRGSRIHHILYEEAPNVNLDRSKKDKDILPYLQAYMKFRNSLDFKILGKEMVVKSDKYQYAGTADVLIKTFWNEIWLLDYKTGGIYKEAGLQLSAYKHALEEDKKIKIDRLFVLSLNSSGNFKLIPVEDNFPTFLAALELFKFYDKSSQTNPSTK